MESIHIWIAIAGAALLCGCSEWPPQEQEFIDHFNENRAGIEALKVMLEESRYKQVSRNFSGTLSGKWFEGDPDVGQVGQREPPENSDDWIKLFNQVGLDSIQARDDGGVLLPAGNYVREKGFESYASYIQSSDIQKRIHRCEEQHAEATCGNCIVNLDADWWLTYGWWPSDLTDKEFDAWQNEEITDDEFYDRQDHILKQCFADGGTLIGTPDNQ